jgi:hypothetical protein
MAYEIVEGESKQSIVRQVLNKKIILSSEETVKSMPLLDENMELLQEKGMAYEYFRVAL